MFETKSIRETCVQLDSDIDKGLTEKEAARRYEENGKNELKEPRKKTVVESFLEQLNDPADICASCRSCYLPSAS